MLCRNCGRPFREHFELDKMCPGEDSPAPPTYWTPSGRSNGLPFIEPAENPSVRIPSMRKFETGATRNVDTNKLDFEGFLSPIVLTRYAEYMHKNRVQADGQLRAADNWQKGMPTNDYMKSGFRHFMEWWKAHRAGDKEAAVEALCALLFNVMGYMFEALTRTEPKQ